MKIRDDEMPPLGTYKPEMFMANWPHCWPKQTPIDAIQKVRVFIARSPGHRGDKCVSFIYKPGLAPTLEAGRAGL